jgi:mannose-1-phosphate guanylyltransferase
MKAIVLCAGLGTRLQPLTHSCPKPAIPFLGVPLIRYTLASLKRAGVSHVAVNVFHLPKVMEAVARAECNRLSLDLTVSHEEREIRGTGGGIAGLVNFFDGETVVVLNGDVLFDVDIAKAVRAHHQSGAATTMVLMPMPSGEKYNAVDVDSDGWVRRIAQKGKATTETRPFHFTGMHVMSAHIDNLKERLTSHGSQAFDINHEVYVPMLEAGLRIHAHVVDGGVWADLGTPSRYLKGHIDALSGQWSAASFAETPELGAAAKCFRPQNAAQSVVTESSRIDSSARVGPLVFISRNATVSAGAQLRESVVLEGAVVKAGAELSHCIVMSDGTIVDAQ